jgi:hypothetical protein
MLNSLVMPHEKVTGEDGSLRITMGVENQVTGRLSVRQQSK